MEVAELVWNSVSLPRQRFIMWLAMQNKLLTKDRLLSMNIQVDDMNCCLCQAAVLVETNTHLFVECEYAVKVRDALVQWSKISVLARDLKITLELIKLKHWRRFKKQVIAAVLGAMVYHIWKARNWKQFKKVQIQHTEIVSTIIREIVERIEMYKYTKKANRCRNFWQKLCN
ncbi:uncharacterized protein [Solanum tuberosum]|uniref:uncharacterized protein n=1 Tax=Solanum tuberosum TaxID=4113 RepID=UPI00073A052D|nr:PREDICTED: uncharacterized protein LOC107059678 [Solanum tuberosum]